MTNYTARPTLTDFYYDNLSNEVARGAEDTGIHLARAIVV
jgi:hypothetical protein